MRGLFLLLVGVMVTTVQAAVVEQVVEGEPTLQHYLDVGTSRDRQVRRADSEDDFRTWLTVCRDLEGGETLRTTCVSALRSLQPPPSVLISSFQVAGADIPDGDRPWMLSVGEQVPADVVRCLLTVIRTAHHAPLVVRGWNDEPWIISIGPVIVDGPPPLDEHAWTMLSGAFANDADFRTALGRRPTAAVAPSTPGAVEKLVDLDLRSPDGKPTVPTTTLMCAGVTWTSDGLFLPGSRLQHFPFKLPGTTDLAPVPTAPYQADIILPDLPERTVTITLLICQASNDPERDNLFTLGQRSRWLSAQVGRLGEVLVGLENRWWMVPARDGQNQPLIVTPMHWHAITVAIGSDGQLIRVMVDDHSSPDAKRPERDSYESPRRIAEPDRARLSFVDPGMPRHLHGLVRRVIVHRGMLDPAAIAALHHQLAPADLPAPTTPAFATPLLGEGLPTEDPPRPVPEDVKDF